MVSTPSPRLRVELQGTGDSLNVWGQKLNDNALALLEEAVAGVETIALTGVNVTLTSTNYTTDQARNFALHLTGSSTPTGVNIVVPSVEKVYAVRNDATGPVIVKTSAGTGVSIASGSGALIACDGTDCYLSAATVQPSDIAAAFKTTSATSTTVGTGAKTFTLAGSNLAFSAGTALRIARTSDPSNVYMDGAATAYSGTTLTVDVLTTQGSGTYSDWTITMQPPAAVQAASTTTAGLVQLATPVQAASGVSGALAVTPDALLPTIHSYTYAT